MRIWFVTVQWPRICLWDFKKVRNKAISFVNKRIEEIIHMFNQSYIRVAERTFGLEAR